MKMLFKAYSTKWRYSLVGPPPDLLSVSSGYAPIPAIVHTHSLNISPEYILKRNMKKVGHTYHNLYKNERST